MQTLTPFFSHHIKIIMFAWQVLKQICEYCLATLRYWTWHKVLDQFAPANHSIPLATHYMKTPLRLTLNINNKIMFLSQALPVVYPCSWILQLEQRTSVITSWVIPCHHSQVRKGCFAYFQNQLLRNYVYLNLTAHSWAPRFFFLPAKW